MRTITFYSYKGGVGRTLAAANFAAYLAKLGQKTLVIDFDLEAPGIDSKFPMLELPANQKGLLDYVLDYQQTNTDPGEVKQICLRVPLDSSEDAAPLWLIPAGDYLSPDYYRKLNQLNWSVIFSEDREGVAFFQEFLARVEKELQPDFVIVDSRTGISEIAGLCTQQLADEVVMLSSLSAESIKVTKHIKRLIRQSEVARELGKTIDVKIVVSRVPKPEDLEALKKRCCELFAIDETKLFFLFSCSALEQEEFLAIATPNKDEELTSGYVRLFYGLNIELASASIQAEIERAARDLLSTSPEESERKILELATLYPHPEVYRTAMRFFRLVDKAEAMRTFGWKLLDLVPDDEDAQRILARNYLADRLLKFDDIRNAVRVLEPLWQRKELSPKEAVRYADLLEDVGHDSKSFGVALFVYKDERLDADTRIQARSIAARTALKLGQRDVAVELIPDIPQEQLSGSLVPLAMEIRQGVGDLQGAFEIAKQALRRDIREEILEPAVLLARQLNRIEELEVSIRSSQLGIRGGGLERKAYLTLRRLGLSKLAREIEQM